MVECTWILGEDRGGRRLTSNWRRRSLSKQSLEQRPRPGRNLPPRGASRFAMAGTVLCLYFQHQPKRPTASIAASRHLLVALFHYAKIGVNKLTQTRRGTLRRWARLLTPIFRHLLVRYCGAHANYEYSPSIADEFCRNIEGRKSGREDGGSRWNPVYRPK